MFARWGRIGKTWLVLENGMWVLRFKNRTYETRVELPDEVVPRWITYLTATPAATFER